MNKVLFLALIALVAAQTVAPASTPVSAPTDETKPVKQCTSGICCTPDGYFKTAANKCKIANNPCEKDTYCTGGSADCPQPEPKLDGSSCMGNGECKTGFCVLKECVGECCSNGKVAADGEECASGKGTCSKGTCVIVKKKVVKKPTEAEKKAEKKVRAKLEGQLKKLLKTQERYVISRETKKLKAKEAKESYLEKLANLPVFSQLKTVATSTSKNIAKGVSTATDGAVDVDVTNLQSSLTDGSRSFNTYVIIGAIAVVAAFIVLVIVIRSGGKKQKKVQRSRPERHEEDNTDSLYEPPDF